MTSKGRTSKERAMFARDRINRMAHELKFGAITIDEFEIGLDKFRVDLVIAFDTHAEDARQGAG